VQVEPHRGSFRFIAQGSDLEQFGFPFGKEMIVSGGYTPCIQDCGAVVKVTQLRLRRSFHEHGFGSNSGTLGFHECGSGSGALFFHDSGFGYRLGFCSFAHINILIALVCLKLNGK